MEKSRVTQFIKVAFILLAVGAITLWAPNSAKALTMGNSLVYSQGSLILNPSDDVWGNVYSGGSITGGSTDTIHGNASAQGSIGSTINVTGNKTTGVASNPLDPANTILSKLSALGYTYTTISGTATFNSLTAAGVYYVTGSVIFSSGATGNWTIISVGSWTGGASAPTINSYISPSPDFSYGLVGYTAGSMTGLGNIYGALAAGGSITMAANSGVFPDGPAAVPEPLTIILLGSGLVGLAVTRRRVKK